MRKFVRLTTLALTVSLVSATPLFAQTVSTPDRTPQDVQRAAALHARAMALLPQPQHYAEAAEFLREAADLLTPADLRSAHDLMLSGQLAFYAGNLSQSRGTLERAAAIALDHGDVAMAASGDLDAAFVAMSQRQTTGARELVFRADELAQSPGLTIAQREQILKRVRLASGPVQLGE